MIPIDAVPSALRRAVERGEIGGRTVQLTDAGEVETVSYEPAPLAEGAVRVRTVRSVISSGTEMTFYGRSATNVYLHRRWNEDLRLFEPGEATMSYPLVVGYRAAGEVVESRARGIEPGLRVFGSWHHTELTTLSADRAAAQQLPNALSWDDGVDIAQMGPICVNAVAYGEGEHRDRPAVVFGAGVIGLLTAQIVRASGASTVHVIDRVPERLAVAASLGFETLDAGSASMDVAASLKRLHGADGVPVVWECTGSTRGLHEAIRTVRRRGAVVAVGFYQGDGQGLKLGDEFHHNGVRVVCGQIGNIHPAHSWGTLQSDTLGLALTGRLILGGLPRLTLPVEDAARGFAALERPGEVLQVALTYE